MAKIIPTYFASNLFEVEPRFFLKHNIHVLLLDLDNTLDSYKEKLPTKRTIEYIARLKEANIRPIIASNNRKKRVARYAIALNVEYFSFIRKPHKGPLLKKLKRLKINPDECLLVGDQLLTDVKCGNKANIKTLYTNKLTNEDSIFTHINRIFEKPKRARLINCGKLNNWKNNL